MVRSSLFSLICMLSATFASAATWYVKPGGGTPANGTSPATAFASIVAAGNAATAANSVILVAGGTYHETALIPGINDGLQLKGSYDSSFTTQDPVGNPTIVDNSNLAPGVFIDQLDAWLIDGFQFKNCMSSTVGGGIRVNWDDASITGAQTGTISRCTFINCTAATQGSAIYVANNRANHVLTITDCTITGCTGPVAAAGGATNDVSLSNAAIYFNVVGTANGPALIIDRMTVKDCITANDAPVLVVSKSQSVTRISNMLISNCQNTKTGVGDGGLIWLRGGQSTISATQPSYFANVTFVNCKAPNYLVNYDTGADNKNIAIANNIFYGNTITVFTAGSGVAPLNPTLFVVGAGSSLRGTWSNNLFFGNTGPSGLRVLADNGTATQVNYSSTLTAPSNLTADPLFVSPTTGDYNLLGASPARDTGVASVVLTDGTATFPTDDILSRIRPYGAAFDRGAYETPVVLPNAIANWTRY